MTLTADDVETKTDPLHRKARRKVEAADEQVDLAGPVRLPATATYPVPADEAFSGAEYTEDVALLTLARKLIDANPTFQHMNTLDIRYYWKRRGGQGAGRIVQGKCLKPSGLLRHETKADFVIWLAADGCQGFSRHQVEALLFHEMCHIGRDDKGNRSLVPHDVQAFAAEVRIYGLWASDLRLFGKAVRQISLDDASDA